MVTDIAFGAGDRGFDSWASQIAHSVANSSLLLRQFFVVLSCVAQALSHGEKLCHLELSIELELFGPASIELYGFNRARRRSKIDIFKEWYGFYDCWNKAKRTPQSWTQAGFLGPNPTLTVRTRRKNQKPDFGPK